MTFNEFKNTLFADTPPEGINDLLTALWYAVKDDWERSHTIAQDIPGRDGAWIHAYLHRVEGDTGNAGYWYSAAGKPMCNDTLEIEWEELVRAML